MSEKSGSGRRKNAVVKKRKAKQAKRKARRYAGLTRKQEKDWEKIGYESARLDYAMVTEARRLEEKRKADYIR